MPNYAKIEGHPNFVKDRNTGAILNQDRKALEEYLARREVLVASKKTENELNNMREELDQIKQLLKEALNK